MQLTVHDALEVERGADAHPGQVRIGAYCDACRYIIVRSRACQGCLGRIGEDGLCLVAPHWMAEEDVL